MNTDSIENLGSIMNSRGLAKRYVRTGDNLLGS